MADSIFPVIWLTGHSGAGKTTLAKALRDVLYMDGEWPVILDGDEMRESITRECDLTAEGRASNNYRIAHLARVLRRQVPVIVSVIAPSADVRHRIDELTQPIWVYVTRKLPTREGHWYQPPLEHVEKPRSMNSVTAPLLIDTDTMTPAEEAKIVIEHVDFVWGKHAGQACV